MIDARLVTFLKLCDLMNYRQTAEALNLTQPAVTQQMKLLEQDYGCKLFLYDKRTLAKTQEANALQLYAQNLLYQDRKIREKLHQSSGRCVRIGATKTIGEFVISRQVAEFAMAPGNMIDVEIDNTERLLSNIVSGSIDFALVEGFFDRAKFSSILYRKEPFIGICSKQHPFAGKTIHLDRIWSEHLLIREEGSGTRDIFEQMLAEHNHGIHEFNKSTTISHFGLMLDVLQRVNGITFAYEAVLKGHEELTGFRVNGLDITREFNYVFLDNSYAEEAVTYFDSFR